MLQFCLKNASQRLSVNHAGAIIISPASQSATPMKPFTITPADIDRTETWLRYRKGLCDSCMGGCCSLPVEVRIDDLIRLGVADEFERDEPLKLLARRLQKQGTVQRLNQKSGVFTLSQRSNGDCLFLHPHSRRCTVYEQRPDTCRNHPQVGPRPGFCAYRRRPS